MERVQTDQQIDRGREGEGTDRPADRPGEGTDRQTCTQRDRQRHKQTDQKPNLDPQCFFRDGWAVTSDMKPAEMMV